MQPTDKKQVDRLLSQLEFCKALMPTLCLAIAVCFAFGYFVPDLQLFSWGLIATSVLALLFAFLYKGSLITRIAKFQDARILPWLVDFLVERRDNILEHEDLVATVARILMQFKPEDIWVLTAKTVPYFNGALEKGYADPMMMDMRLFFSKKKREHFLETQITLRLGILNVLPLVGNDRSLKIMERLLKQVEEQASNFDSRFVEALQQIGRAHV